MLNLGKQKSRKLLLATISGGALKLISLIIVILTVKWGLAYLGEIRFGIWITISSLIALSSIVDFGVNNNIVNLAGEYCEGGESKLRVGISNSYFVLFIISAIILVFMVYSYYFFDYGKLFNIRDQNIEIEAKYSFAIYMIFLALLIPGGVVYKVKMGLQDSWKVNIWLFTGQLLSLIMLWMAIRSESNLPVLIAAITIPQLLVCYCCSFNFFYKNSKICPKFHDVNWLNLKKIFGGSLLFLLIQIMSTLANASDNFIITNIIGPEAIAEFNIAQKLSILFGVAQLFIAPLWPIFSEALSRSNKEKSALIYKKSMEITIIISMIMMLVAFLSWTQIIEIWTSNTVVVNSELLSLFSINILISALGGIISSVMNTEKFLKLNATIFTIASLVTILLKIYLTDLLLNTSAIVAATMSGFLFFYIIPCHLIIKRYHSND